MWKWLLLALLWPALGQDEEEPVDIISAKQLRELHTKFDTNKDGKATEDLFDIFLILLGMR